MLSGAYLYGASLGGAHLERVEDLTSNQIELTFGNKETKLPEYLVDHRPLAWTKATKNNARAFKTNWNEKLSDWSENLRPNNRTGTG